MKIKKLLALLLSALIMVGIAIIPAPVMAASSTNLLSNGNGYSTDVGIWYVPYNTPQLFNNNWAGLKIGYRQLIGYDENGKEIFGIPNSADVDMLDFDIEQIANAGIDFIVIDLTNGGLAITQEKDSNGNPITEHCIPANKLSFHIENTKKLCQRIAEWNKKNEWKIRYAIAVGTHTGITKPVWSGGIISTVTSYDCTVAEAGEWQAEAVYKHFYTDEEIGGDNYYHLDGKPLILFHDWANNALTVTPPKTFLGGVKNATLVGWNMYEGKKYGNYFTVRPSQAGESGTYGWHTTTTKATGDSEVEMLCPSHLTAGEKIANSTLTRNNGKRYRDSWNSVLARETLPRIIMLSAYNDYCEDHALAVTASKNCDGVYDEVWYDPDGNYTTDYYWNLTKQNIKAVRSRSTKQEVGNLGLSATVELDGSQWLENNGYGKAQLNDGITDDDISDGLKWASALYAGDKYCHFELDFATAQTVNNVVFYQPKGSNAEYNKRPQELAVDLKLKDGSWVRVGEKHNLSIADKSDTYVHNFVFAPKTDVVAVRITGSKARNTQTNILNMHACELEVYYNPAYTYKDYTRLDTEENAAYQIPMPDYEEEAIVADYNFATDATVTLSKQNQLGSIAALNDGVYNNNNFAVVVMSSKQGYANLTLDGAKTINYVKVSNSAQQSASRPMEYAVDVKTADGVWKRVAERHNVSIGNKVLEFKFAPVADVTDVRVLVNQARNDGTSFKAWCVEEIEVYYRSDVTATDYTGIEKTDDATYAISMDSTNVALTGLAYNSNVDEGTYGTYHPRLVNNGIFTPDSTADNTILYYMSSGDAYIGIKLAGEYTVNKVVLRASSHEATRRVMDVAVDVKLKNGKWLRVAELHNREQYRDETFYFAPVKCVEVRITTNKARLTDNINWRVGEIEIFYDSTVTKAKYTGIQPVDDSKYFIRMWDNTTNDVNDDYNVDTKDLVELKKTLLGRGSSLSDCDVNVDNSINIIDYIQFMKQMQY